MQILKTSLLLAAFTAAGATPETSKLFVRHVDPESGIESLILKPKMHSFNQQSIYFTCKSFTLDGRFLLFFASDGETGEKRLACIDFEQDRAFDTGINGQLPFLDVARNELFYTDKRGFVRRDLSIDPLKDIRLCDFPAELKPEGIAVQRYFTHLTLSPDRRLAFLDSCIGGRNVQGTIDLATGKYEKWGEAPFCANHGQFNPVDPTMAMVAWEGCWLGEVGANYKQYGAIYPRMWIVQKGYRYRLIPTVQNYATHEKWSEDGKGVYFCSKKGVWYHEIATDRQFCISPSHAVHANLTADNKYVAWDGELEPNYRGCRWRVGFHNRDTGKDVWIHSSRPALNPRARESIMHPDPHPTFVCGDRYVVCTINNADGHMDLSLTPVATLVAATGGAR